MRITLSAIAILISSFVSAQENYRTISGGNWGNPGIWQRETPNGSGVWVAAIAAPDVGDNAIAIRSGHIVTVSSNLAIDQTSVNAGGALVVDDGVTINLNNGAGVDLFLYNGGSVSLTGESVVSGNGYFYIAGTLRLGSINSSGAITAGIAATGNVRTASRIWGASAIVRYSGTSPQVIGSGHPSVTGVTTIIDNPTTTTLNNSASTTVTMKGPVQVLSGVFIVSNNNLSCTSSLTLNGGDLSLVNPTGFPQAHSFLNVVLTNGDISASTTTSPITVTIDGTLAMIGGNFTVTSGSSNFTLMTNGDISGTGLIVTSGDNNIIKLQGTGAYSHSTFPIATNSTIKSLTIDRSGLTLTVPYSLNITSLTMSSGALIFTTPQTIPSALNLASGTSLDFSGTDLTLNYAINTTLAGGLFVSNSFSNLIIGGATSSASNVAFSPGSALNDFTVDRANGGSIELTSTLALDGKLTLARGSFINNGTLTMGPSSEIERNSLATMSGTAPVGGPYDVVYTGNSITPGSELAGPVNDLSLNQAGTLTLTNNLNLDGNLTVNSGSFIAGPYNVALESIVNLAALDVSSTVLTVGGNISNGGLISLGTGTTIFNGNALQSITGDPIGFNNVTISENSSISFETPHALRGRMTVSNGAFVDADGILDGGRLTLLSASNEESDNGSIGPIPASATVTGEFTVQRYVSAMDNVHRFISSPITNATVAQLQDDLPVTGDFTGTSYPCTGCNNNGSSMFWFQEGLGGAYNDRYTVIPTPLGSNAELLEPGRGYDVYMWSGGTGTRIDFTGPINQGNFSFGTLSHTASAVPDPSTDGWHLLGNPYPCTIDWSNATGWERSNVDPTVWVWDKVESIWRSYHVTEGGNLPDGLIASGQGFWVRANSGGGTLSVNEGAKSSGFASHYRKGHKLSGGLKISLSDGSVWDDARILRHDRASLGFDEGLDSYKFRGGIEKLSIAVEDNSSRALAYMFINHTENPSEIPLSISVRDKGEYYLSFENIAGDDSFSDYVLWDKYLGKELSLSTPYQFTVGEEATEARFALRVKGLGINSERARLVEIYPNPAVDEVNITIHSESVDNISILNGMGTTVKHGVLNKQFGVTQTQLSLLSLPPGVYFVKTIFSGNRVEVHKLIKQ